MGGPRLYKKKSVGRRGMIARWGRVVSEKISDIRNLRESH